jgi:hypothetical protein
VIGQLWFDTAGAQLYVWENDGTSTQWVIANAAGVPQAGTISPFMNGVAAPGTLTPYSRVDHIHPSDISRAPLASPVFTGDPQAPTPATADNDTSVATTAFVKAQGYATTGSVPVASATNPIMDGVVAVGTLTTYARADHVHASDTSRFAVTGGTITGAVTLTAAGTALTATGSGAINGVLTLGTNTSTNTSLLQLNGAAGSYRRVVYLTAGLERWRVHADFAAEGGSNAGSDFNIDRYDDTGTVIGNSFKITRSTNQVAMPGPVSTGLLTGSFNIGSVLPTPPGNGFMFGWNRSGGGRETAILNCDTLAATSFNFYQYTSATTVSLLASLTPSLLSLPNVGLSCGSTVAASTTDLSKHIALYSTTYGLDVTSGPSRLNYVVPAGASHVKIVGTTDVLSIGATIAASVAMTALTPATADNSTNVATTAFVKAQGYSTALGTVTSITAGAGLSGGVITASGTIAIAASGVTNAMQANMPANTISGNNTGIAAAPIDLTVAQAQALLVVPAASATNPVMDGVVNIGTLANYARADHVHASDTSRFAVAGGTITGLTSFSQDVSFAGGVDFGSVLASSSIDLSKHIALFGTTYGLNITNSRLNIVTPSGGVATFWNAGTNVLAVGATINANTTLNMGGNPFQLGGTSYSMQATAANDGATFSISNIQLNSFNGFGITPSFNVAAATQMIPNGLNGLLFDVRMGRLTTTGYVRALDTSFASQLGALRVARVGTNLNLDIPTTMTYASLTSIAAGGTGWTVNDRAYDAYNNIYTITAVSAGVATTVVMDSSLARIGTPPANPVALTTAPGNTSLTGAGLTVNVTWNVPTSLVLQHAAGGVTISSTTGTTVTGGLTSTTPASSDSSTTVATTAFVQTAAGNTIRTAVAATPSQLTTDGTIILNPPSACTLTLLAAATYPGRILRLKLIAAFAVTSVSANVVPLVGGAAVTAIMPATAGKYAVLQSDGTNWQIVEAN